MNVYHLAGTKFCCTENEGTNFNKEIRKRLDSGDVVTLDFGEVEVCSTHFYFTMLHGLYKDYTQEFLRQYLKVTGMDPYKQDVLRRCAEVVRVKQTNQEGKTNE